MLYVSVQGICSHNWAMQQLQTKSKHHSRSDFWPRLQDDAPPELSHAIFLFFFFYFAYVARDPRKLLLPILHRPITAVAGWTTTMTRTTKPWCQLQRQPNGSVSQTGGQFLCRSKDLISCDLHRRKRTIIITVSNATTVEESTPNMI